MPLKARVSGRTVHSFDLPAGLTWSDVQAASRNAQITMPCCGAAGIAKRLASGTRFFAHKAKSPSCDWKPESEEHLRFKAAACEAAIAAGTEADVEVRSSAEGPAEWVADVLTTHNGVRRVIEIQLAPQTIEETRRRTRRYRQAGMEVLWLFRKLPEGMKIGQDLPVIVLDEDPEKAEKTVRGSARHFAVGNIAWDEGRYVIPFTAVGYDVLCANCGERYHHTPYAILRRSEINGRMSAIAVPLGSLSVMGSGPWRQTWLGKQERLTNDPLGRRMGGHSSSCPYCRASGPASPLSAQEAFSWPHNQVDGEANWYRTPDWYPKPQEPVPYAPRATEAEWQELLREKGLLIDPALGAAYSAERRRDYEERDRRHKEAEQKRRQEIEERHRERVRRAARLAKEIEGDDPRTAVQVTVSWNGDSIGSITVKCPYDAEGIKALKEAGGRWDPSAKTWTIGAGYGEFRTAELVRDTVHEMRSRLDRKRR